MAAKSIFRGFKMTAFESFVSIYEENPKVHLCNCSLYQQGAQRQRSRCASVTDSSAQWMRQCCDTDDFENFVQDSITTILIISLCYAYPCNATPFHRA